MVNFVRSIEHIFVLFCLLGTLHIATCYDEEESDVIPPGEEEEWEEVDPEPPEYTVPKGVQTLEFNPANLTDEDQHSMHMPRDLVCDGCRIIAYQLTKSTNEFERKVCLKNDRWTHYYQSEEDDVMTKQLKRIQDRYKVGHRLSEMDVVDILDQVCTDQKEKFHGYGIKEINGKRRLSGEGLETEKTPGVLKGGGRWPSRLEQMCAEYVGHIGEAELYGHFLVGNKLENVICRNKELGNICPPKRKRRRRPPYPGESWYKDEL